jgi:hypothetical protein
MSFFSSIPTWGWFDIGFNVAVLVALGGETDVILRRVFPDRAVDLLPPEAKRKKLKKICEWLLIVGIAGEIGCLPFSLYGTASAERDAAEARLEAAKLELQIEQNKSENHPITSISAIATFRIKGDFSPPPLPYPDLLEPTGAGILFLQGTNISGAVPSISLGADAANISILNLIPNNEHPDTHDVVITFHDSGDVMYGHFFNKWMWQNKAGFFEHVKGFSISMRQIGSNVCVLSGKVVVIANDLKWEFPIPPQKQRLGQISCKIIKNAKNQDEAEVMPYPLMDMTSRPLGYFDGK